MSGAEKSIVGVGLDYGKGVFTANNGLLNEGVKVRVRLWETGEHAVKPGCTVWRDLRQSLRDEKANALGSGVGNGENFGDGSGAVCVGHDDLSDGEVVKLNYLWKYYRAMNRAAS